MAAILPAQLLTKTGLKATKEILANKRAVALYFSAHWCPPCRGFTPVAAEFYKSLAGSDPSALEVVFVSSDEDDESFSHYYDTMPWTALQFSDRSAAEALGAKFGIRGIPALIVLNPAGDVVDQDGRSTLTKNKDAPAGALASWVK